MLSKNSLRPWGQISWLWPQLPQCDWSLLGCVGVEERCAEAWRFLHHDGKYGFVRFICVEDPPSRHLSIANARINILTNAIRDISPPSGGVVKLGLLCPVQAIVEAVNNFITSSGGNVVLDISSFPKRFFFPILKQLWQSNDVRNLVVCYTIPKEYARESLAEDPMNWDAIPTFAPTKHPEPDIEVAFVGVGFMPMGLGEIVKTELSSAQVFPLMPFPPYSNRNWQFVQSLESGLPNGMVQPPIRVDARDVSETFDQMMIKSNYGQMAGILAPYGPKPMSLAMALFSILKDYPVLYTQPQSYNPLYSSGVQYEGGKPAILSYLLRADGNNFYSA